MATIKSKLLGIHYLQASHFIKRNWHSITTEDTGNLSMRGAELYSVGFSSALDGPTIDPLLEDACSFYADFILLFPQYTYDKTNNKITEILSLTMQKPPTVHCTLFHSPERKNLHLTLALYHSPKEMLLCSILCLISFVLLQKPQVCQAFSSLLAAIGCCKKYTMVHLFILPPKTSLTSVLESILNSTPQ